MLGFHWPELLVVIAIMLVFFGPKRLPEMGASIGKTIKEFQKSMHEVTEPERVQAPAIPPAAETPAASASQQIPEASATASATPAAPLETKSETKTE